MEDFFGVRAAADDLKRTICVRLGEIAGTFLLAILGLSVSIVILQREHVAAERSAQPEDVAFARANQRCERNEPPLATGWTLSWNAGAQTYTCVYDRNGRRTGRTLEIRRNDL